VQSFEGCWWIRPAVGASVIVRGLRAVSDFSTSFKWR
jgi:phosphopantetheine adenylyltransferase